MTGNVDGWTLVRINSDAKTYTSYATTDILSNTTKTGSVNQTVTASTIEQFRKVKDFENFGKDVDNVNTWSLVSGVVNRGGTSTWDNASVRITIDSSVKDVAQTDLMGLSNLNGTLNLTGNKTEIIAKNLGSYTTVTGGEGDECMDAVGYDSYDMDKRDPNRKVVTNFKAADTYIEAQSQAVGGSAMAMLIKADDIAHPEITVDGNLTLKATSAQGNAYGIESGYSDSNTIDGTPQTGDNRGFVKAKKNVTVDVNAKDAAYGLYAHVGTIDVGGNDGVTTINVNAKESHGIRATSTGVVKVSGKQATITAKGTNANALTITDDDDSEQIIKATQAGTPTVVLAAQSTTLNGKTSVSQNGLLEVAHTVNFNGDADIQGQLTAKSDATLQVANGKTLKLGESQSGKNNTFAKNLTIAGGTFQNKSQMDVKGDLVLNGVTATNGEATAAKAAQTADITANKVIFGNGTKFVNYGGLHAKHYKLETGSLYLEEDKVFTVSDNKLAIKATKDILELAGGELSNITSNGQKKLKEINIEGNQTNDAVVLVSNGNYAFDKVTVNMDKQDTGATLPARLMVTGGTVKAEELFATKGNASVTDSGILNVTKLVSNGKFEMDVQTANGFKVSTFEGQNGGDFTLTGGTMTVDTLTLNDGKLTISTPATLVTSTGQIFANALNGDGTNNDAGNFKHNDKLVFAQDSTLTLTDAKYNFEYVASAKNSLKQPTLVFSGQLVDAQGNVRDEIGVDSVVDGTVHENTNLAATATDKTGSVTIDRNVGGQTLVVDKGNTVAVETGKTLTLAGTADPKGELVDFRDASGEKKVTATGNKGGVTVGSTTKNTTGKLSAKVELSSNAKLTAQNGAFTFVDVSAQDAHVNVASGSLTVEKLAVSGTSSIASAEKAETKVTELTLADNGTTTVTGAVTADKITVAEGKTATLNVGKSDKRGDLTVGKDSVLKGLTFFLDPTWVEGKEVTDASRLVINKTDLDGNVIVGHNSYVVLGSASDADFVKLFQDGTLTWGRGKGKALAAAYVAKPITINSGSLVVDGSLEQAPTNAANAGSVTFAAGSVLVADVTDVKSGTALITGSSFTVDKTSKAVIIGDLKNGEKYKLTSEKGDFWNKKDTLVSGNPLWNLSANADGTFGADLADAKVVFGDLMQGHAIANAGMLSDKADLKAYVNKLLTDELGKAPLDMLGARFDAAMNVAGAAATFTTAYDRASEFRDAVRGEAIAGEGNRLWAQITGGKTKLKGISTGAQSLHVDTDAYGLVIGGDTVLNGYTVGAAFTAGKGDSENKAVGVKDDFDFYGLSVYGKTAVAGVDLVADASMTFLKSDLTMGGVADVDTDTDTTVYSMGVQAQKTFDFGVDVTPYVGLDLYHLRADGYSNGHGAQVDDANATALEIPMGATVSKAFDTTSGFKLKPVFHFAVVPTVGDRDIDSKVRFAGAQSTYNFTFADDVKVRTGLGLAAEKDNFRFGFNAGYDWGNEERAATKLMLNAQYLF